MIKSKLKIVFLIFIKFIFINAENTILDPSINLNQWSIWSLSKELFDYIRSNLKEGKVILELGSGWSTGQLSNYYKMYSVEHDKKWLNLYNTKYIYAPIVNNWYDCEILKKEIPNEYDLLLVDGPPEAIGRSKFLDNLDLFKPDVLIIFDDVNREKEYALMVQVADRLNRQYKVFKCADGKAFAVLNNDIK